MAMPSDEERFLLGQLLAKTNDILTTEELKSEPYLIRWLRARELNVGKAEKMIRDSFKWRKAKKMDDILEKKIDAYFHENYPYWMDMVDRDGRAVLVMPIGQWDVRTAVDDGRTEEFQEFTNQFFEKLLLKIKQSKAAHPDWPHTQCVCVVDWDGFSFLQIANMSAANQMLQMAITYEAHFPEILHHVFFINTNSVFATFFKMLKPLLAARTLDKIHIYGTDKEEWASPLLELIAKDQLLPQHGGTKIHGDIF